MLAITDMLDDQLVNNNDSNDRGACDIVMFPPEEKAGEESGSDSDDEDAPEANMNRLPRKMLEAGTTHNATHTHTHTATTIF